MWTKRLRLGLWVCLALVAALAALNALGPAHWLLDLPSHFVFQLFGLALLLFAAAIFLKAIKAGLVGFALASLFLIQFVTAYPAPPQAWGQACQGETVRVVSYNVHNVKNVQAPEAWDAIAALDPDIVILLEVWGRSLPAWYEEAAAEMGYSFRPAAFAAPAILSRWPIAETGSDEDVFRYRPHEFDRIFGARALIQTPGGDLQVYALHLPVPLNELNRRGQDALLADVGSGIDRGAQPVILAGDFNATPWSPLLRAFQAQSGLSNTLAGHLPWPTWYRSFPLLALPIDHIFVSDDIGVESADLLAEWGSDHRAIMADLCLEAR